MNKKNKSTIDIAKKVLKKINKDKVKMRPHVYFVTGLFLLGIGFAATILFSTFLVNIISFKMRVHNNFEYLYFGKPGFSAFITQFPWPLLLLAITGIVGGIFLVKKLDISYKKNLWGIIAALIGFVLIFGIAIDKTGINDKASCLKPLKSIYQTNTLRDQIIKGKVLESGSSSIEIINPNGEIVIIEIPKNMIEKRQFMLDGDYISVFGSWKESNFIIKDFKPRRMKR